MERNNVRMSSNGKAVLDGVLILSHSISSRYYVMPRNDGGGKRKRENVCCRETGFRGCMFFATMHSHILIQSLDKMIHA
jgi:hypothetical protein